MSVYRPSYPYTKTLEEKFCKKTVTTLQTQSTQLFKIAENKDIIIIIITLY